MKKTTLKEVRDAQKDHEEKDIKRFATLTEKIPTKEDLTKIVGNTVDEKINGKLVELKSHLEKQDVVMIWLTRLAVGIISGVGLVIVGVIVNLLTNTKL